MFSYWSEKTVEMGSGISEKTTPMPYSEIKKKNIKYFSSLEMQYLFKSINQRLVSSYTSVEDWDKECFKFQYDYFTFSNDFCNSHHVSFLRIGNGWQIEGNISKSCVAI